MGKPHGLLTRSDQENIGRLRAQHNMVTELLQGVGIEDIQW